jgi:hypothetical protein
VYFTSGGDYGAYGGYAVEWGIIGELSGGLTFHVYWPDSGKSAKENFGGFNGFVAADVGIESLSGGLALYWPKNDFFSPTPSPAPCGVGVVAGYGVGLPINFYVGNSRTFLGVQPPPKLRPHSL